MSATNGHVRGLRADALPAKPKGRKPRPVSGERKPAPVRGLKAWSYAGVGVTLGLSGWLNGLAFAERAPSAAQGWALGVAIPVMVLIFSRVGALLYTVGRRQLAAAAALATLAILLLSVQHCAVSIARLTGEHVALAALMALAVDVGLVVCEVATIRAK